MENSPSTVTSSPAEPAKTRKGRRASTLEAQQRRIRAFALYCESKDGVGRSLRSIGMELGVSLRAVQYWRAADDWDGKIAQAVQAEAEETAKGGPLREVIRLMQTSLAGHIATLNQIIAQAKNVKERLLGIKEFVEIYRKLGIPLPQATPVVSGPAFEDDVPAPHVPAPAAPAPAVSAEAFATNDEQETDKDLT